MTATAEDWSDLEEKVELRETNTMPRPGTTRTPGARRGVRTSKRLDALTKSLSTQMFQAGAMISLGLPVTGTYICQEAEVFPDAVVQLARKKAEWIEALERVSDVGPGIVVGRTVLGIAAAMGTDRYYRTDGNSGFNPDKRACALLGVTAAYYNVHKEDGNASSSEGVFTPPPHPVYQPVG